MRIDTISWNPAQQAEENSVLTLAARELAAYLRKITGSKCSVKKGPGGNAILGQLPEAPLPKGVPLEVSELEDGFCIFEKEGRLHITGCNARSVLFGVYAFLERQGVRFLRPGKDGELIPERKKLDLPVKPVVEKGAYRHRGMCIEGSLSVEHGIEMVKWSAKKRINTIFLQFQTSQWFYNNYYNRAWRSPNEPGPVDENRSLELDDRIIGAAHDRGLVVHRVGHGWTSKAFGMSFSGWAGTEKKVPKSKQRFLAELNGKREIFQKVTTNTELCYSYEPALDAMVEEVVRYAEKHPEVDVIHVWLSDAGNNKCECKDCRKLTISDWYMRLISEISRRLKDRAPKSRVVFLSYIELWWPPEKEKFTGHFDNVILMYAPICRAYDRRLADETHRTQDSYPRPPLNKLYAPSDNAFYAWSLEEWRKVFPGDSFDFDYHLMWYNWHQHHDLGVAKLLHDDVRELAELGLNGYVSCQSWRCWYPTGLAMTVLADALWNPKGSWKKRRTEYFEAAYGKDAEWADAYCAHLEKRLPTVASHREAPPLLRLTAKEFPSLREHLEAGLAEAKKRRAASKNPVHARSLLLLEHHAQLLLRMLTAVEQADAGNKEAAFKTQEEAGDFVRKTEKKLHHEMDAMMVLGHYVFSYGPGLRDR